MNPSRVALFLLLPILACTNLVAGEISIQQVVGQEIPGKYKHPASITELKNGDLMVVYFGGDGEYLPGTAIYGMRLPKGETTWTSPVMLANTPERMDGNAVIWQTPGEEVWLLYVTRYGKEWSTARIKLKISTDGGKTFSDSMLVTEETGYMVRNKPIVKEDGNYLIPAYHEYGTDTQVSDHRNRGLFLHYDVQTRSFSKSNEFTYRKGVEQPAVVQLDKDHFIAYCRRGGDYEKTDDGWMVFTESHDGGWTWSNGIESPFPNPNSAIDLTKLQNGHLLLIYNDHMYLRRKLTVAVSTDQGKTFPTKKVLMNDNAGMAYPYMIQASNGDIHVIFTYNRVKVMHAVFREEDLLK
ncbi:MAG: exo-alpha-sialidase [Planctomycetaceae bacterium]|nr:exo-alpha-sialidase [Planctomycetaceae bacterium]